MARLPSNALNAQNGVPEYGRIIRYWRKQVLGWRDAGIIVDLYNEQARQIGEPEISLRWWQRMEQQNRVPIDPRKRRIIQVLLGIPAAYLSLAAVDSLSVDTDPEKLWTMEPGTLRTLDLQRYQQQLATFWRSRETRKPEVFVELLSRTANLEQAVLYGGVRQRAAITQLLCHYLLAAGNACRYQGYMQSALAYLKKALILAREHRQDDPQYTFFLMKASYLRGFTQFNRWTNAGQDRDADLCAAIADFKAADALMRQAAFPISSAIRTAILADGGRAYACRARDRVDSLAALKNIDQAERLVGVNAYESDPLFLRVDAEWVHVDKAEALIAGGSPALALEELGHVYQQGDPQARQRYFYATILEAEASIARGWGDIGAVYLQEVLSALNQTNSRRHLAHIVRLHSELQDHRLFRCSPDVARLSADLLRLQHPELFA
ncbi:MAG TPA: hypothetical protein VGF67_07595 [Ktedonobacteraceae bacterium]|jgi:hypothetical protein